MVHFFFASAGPFSSISWIKYNCGINLVLFQVLSTAPMANASTLHSSATRLTTAVTDLTSSTVLICAASTRQAVAMS
jgi:hypothetical protein